MTGAVEVVGDWTQEYLGCVAGHSTNIAGYRFIALDDLDRLQAVMRSICTDLGLKGTVLLATESINFFLAGTATAVEGFTAFLDGDERSGIVALPVSAVQPAERAQEERNHLRGIGSHQPRHLHRPEIEPHDSGPP